MNEPLSRDRFAQLVAARLRTRGATELKYEAGTFSIGYRLGSGQGFVNLANAHTRALRAAPAQVAKLIDEFLDLQGREQETHGGTYAQEAARLLPVVRDVRYFSMSMLQLRHSGIAPGQIPQVPYRSLAGEVVVALFLDSERSMAQVSNTQLQEWGVSFDTAMQRALENLRARSQPGFSKQGDGLYLGAWNDDYDSSRLLLPELLKALPIRGEPVVGLPARNRLLVAGARDPKALDRLAQATAGLIESEQRPMTAQLLRLAGDRWVAFDDVLPSTPKLREAGFKLLMRDYEQQKALLEAILEKDGTDLFVATWKVFQVPEGVLSLTQWTKNVASLLPKADRLALLDMDTREMLIVPWQQAAALLGDELTPQGMHPERYLVSGYPDAATLKKLRAVAVTKAQV
jgi:hypothetical protein